MVRLYTDAYITGGVTTHPQYVYLRTGSTTGLQQAQFVFETDGRISKRHRERTSTTANWGSWSNWIYYDTYGIKYVSGYSLSSSVSVGANKVVNLFAAYSVASQLPSGATLVDARVTWTDSSNIIIGQSWVSTSGNLSAKVYNPTSSAVTISKVDMVLHYKI